MSRPAVEAAYYEELHGRLLGLLILVEDRLGEHAGYVHRVIDAGEYGLALEDITGILAYARAPVTDQERGDIVTLSQIMHMDDPIGDKLRSCPRHTGTGRQLPPYGDSGQPPAAGAPPVTQACPDQTRTEARQRSG